MSSDVSSDDLFPPFWAEEAFVREPEEIEEAGSPGPEALRQEAQSLLTERIGAEGGPIATAHACGTIGVQADQTHYSEGFGLFLPLQQGVAVAARQAEASRITFAGHDSLWDQQASPPPWVVAVRRIFQELIADQPVEVAVVSTIPGRCRDGYLAALAVAVMRVVRRLDVSTAIDLNSVQSLRDDLVPLLAAEIGTSFNQPYSTGYLLATFAGGEPALTLVDTTTREHLPVETEARTALRWAVIDPGGGEPQSAAFHRQRQKQSEEALRVLRANGFADLTSFRDLEHRDLDDATDVLPEKLAPVAHHLVTENRRVQKHVAAMRRSDWQMVGALTLMSHASQRDHWGGVSTVVEAVVDQAETQTHDGLYGACMTGRSGAVLVVGRPRTFGAELRQLKEAVETKLGEVPRILVP